MLRKSVYPVIEGTLNTLASGLHKKGFSPNQLTLFGLALNLVAGFVYAGGHFTAGGLLLLLAAMGDMLDGPLARVSGRASKFGAFLDSTVDRYSDIFLFGGLALYFANAGNSGWVFISLGIIAGSFVTSYAKARAENLIENCSVGIFERPERIIALALASFIPPLRPWLLGLLFLGTNATALHRILFTQKTLSGKS